jgi:hypothetical protein
MKNCVASQVSVADKEVFLYLHRHEPPRETEWSSALATLRAWDERNGGDVSKMRILVITDGGSPDVSQRAAFNTWLSKRHVPTAVMLASMLARGVVTAFSWFNPYIASFSLEQPRLALQHLGLEESACEGVWEEFERMREQTGPVEALTIVLRHVQPVGQGLGRR